MQCKRVHEKMPTTVVRMMMQTHESCKRARDELQTNQSTDQPTLVLGSECKGIGFRRSGYHMQIGQASRPPMQSKRPADLDARARPGPVATATHRARRFPTNECAAAAASQIARSQKQPSLGHAVGDITLRMVCFALVTG